MQATLPQHNGKTAQFSRYPRVALPMVAATEGVTPTSYTTISVETVQAVVDQWIMVSSFSDLSLITIKHPLVPIVSDLFGLAQAELVDREIQKTLMAGDSVRYALSTATIRADLTAAHVLTSTVLRRSWAALSRNGARTMGKNYALIVDPEVSQDISAEDKFLSAHELAQATAIFNNQIGEWLGFSVEVSNFIPSIILGTTTWTVASNAGSPAGTFANGETANVIIESVNSSTGMVERVHAAKATTLITTDSLTVTVPSITGFVYNVYVSNTNNSAARANMQLVSEAVAASGTVVVSDFPTSSDTARRPQDKPAATNVAIHTSYAIGKDAYGMVKLSGDNLRVLMTDGKPTDSDPAAQRKKISLKGSFKSVILNDDWYERIESASNF
jgi:N4-gp56 family major capsid protein